MLMLAHRLSAAAEEEKTEQPGSGLIRSTALREQSDPNSLYMVVAFDSEEAARAREQDPRRQEGLNEARETMAKIFDTPLEFIDLTVVAETSY